MAVPSAPQTQVPTALGPRSPSDQWQEEQDREARASEAPGGTMASLCLCQGEPCVSEGADECDPLPEGGTAEPCELGSWGEVD